MNGRKNKRAGAVCILAIAILIFTEGCKTVPLEPDCTGNTQSVGQLESTVESLDRATASSRERIEDAIRRSEEIEDGIDKLELLFEAYEREFNILLEEVDRIRNEAEVPEEGNPDSLRNNPPVLYDKNDTGSPEHQV